MYLEGMEQDESVPLAFEGQGGPVDAMPEEFRPAERHAESTSVIDITGLIADLEASRGRGAR